MSGIMSRDLGDMCTLIKRAFEVKPPLAVFVQGPMGVGKSESIRKLAQDLDVKFIDIRLGDKLPEDIAGIPYRDDGLVRMSIPEYLPLEGKGIFLMDEFNTASPQVQNVCMQLILDRKIGTYRLPEGWIVLAVGNRVQDRAAIFDIPKPLCNRFLHIEIEDPSYDKWYPWAMSNGIDMRIVSFLKFKPQLIFTYKSEKEDKAFATPRSWTFLSRLIEGQKESPRIRLFADATVGAGISTVLVGYLDLVKKMDIEAMLQKPEKARIPEGVDIKYSLIGALCQHVKNKPKTVDNAVKLAMRFEPEYAMLFAHMLLNMDIKGLSLAKLAKNPAIDTFMTRFQKYVA